MTLLRRAALTTRRHIITPVGPIDPNAIIMSPSGNDSNAGTLSHPVLTLAKAQALARLNSLSKTVYLRGGTYNITTALILTSSDNTQTWTFYPPDGYNSPILDLTGVAFNGAGNGGYGTTLGNLACIIINGGNHITINGLQIQNFPAMGIWINSGASFLSGTFSLSGTSANNTIINNVLLNGNAGGPPFNNSDGTNANGLYSPSAPAIYVLGDDTANLNNTLCTHNVIMNMIGAGILYQHTLGTNNVASYNYLQSLNIAGQDTGACYTQFVTGMNWLYNYIRDTTALDDPYPHTTAAPSSAGIYGDQNTINSVIQGNIISGSRADTSTYQAFGFMFGAGNVGVSATGNIFDMGPNMGHYCFYDIAPSGTTCIFQSNIIISKFAGAGSFVFNGGQNFTINQSGSGQGGTVTDGPNGYFNYGGGSTYPNALSNSDPLNNDSNPQTANPLFNSGWTYTLASNSPFLSSPVSFPAQPANWGTPGFWGPPGFVIPTSSTLPGGITSPSYI